MQETFEKIEPHLFKRQYETSAGDWRTIYVGIFTDWKGKRRKISLGSDLSAARDGLKLRLADNVKRVDFDDEKKKIEEQRQRTITLRHFGEGYFAGTVSIKRRKNKPKRPRTIARERELYASLYLHFGNMPLADISDKKIQDAELTDHQLGFLRYLLRGAVRNKVISAVPLIELAHAGVPRTGTLSPDEYQTILSHMGREQQRYMIALYETGARLREPLKLTWDQVDFKKRLLRFTAEQVKEDWPRRTPITWELLQVLFELREEQKRVPNIAGIVFTRKNGKPIRCIRESFKLAAEKAGCPKTIPHDFRRTAISRFTELGIPDAIVMAAVGHKPTTVHEKYNCFTDEQLTNAFRPLMISPEERRKMFPTLPHGKELENASGVSY
jgi:integrase